MSNENNGLDVYLGCELEISDTTVSLNALQYDNPTEGASLTDISVEGCLFKMVLEEGQESITLPSIDDLASSFDFVRDIYLDPEQTHLLSLDPHGANQPYHKVDTAAYSEFFDENHVKLPYKLDGDNEVVLENGKPVYDGYAYALDDGREVLVFVNENGDFTDSDGTVSEQAVTAGTKDYTYLTTEGEPAASFGEWVNSHLFSPFDSIVDTILEAQVTIKELSLGMPPTHYRRPGYREITNPDLLYDTHNVFMLYPYSLFRTKAALETGDTITLSNQLWRDSFEDNAKATSFVQAVLASGIHSSSTTIQALETAAAASITDQNGVDGNTIIQALVGSMTHFKSPLSTADLTKKIKLAQVVAYSTAIEKRRAQAVSADNTTRIDELLLAKRQLTADFDNSILPLYKTKYSDSTAKEFTDEAIFDFEFKRTGDDHQPQSYKYDVNISIGWPEDEQGDEDNDFPFSLKAINFRVKQDNQAYSFDPDKTRLPANTQESSE